MAYFSRFWGNSNSNDKEMIAVYSSGGTNVYYTDDDFSSYSTKSVTSGTVSSVNTNGKGCMAIVTSTGYVYFTVDYGQNWSSYNNSGMLASAVAFSEDGRCIILPGNSGGAPYHKLSTNYGQSWVSLPSSIYNSTYGGVACWVNKSGTKGLVACRSSGIGYSTDLNNNTWSLHPRNTGNFGDPGSYGRFASSVNSDAWAYGSASWGYDLLYNRSGNVNSYTCPVSDAGGPVLIQDDGAIYYSYNSTCYLIPSGSSSISTYFTASGTISNIYTDDSMSYVVSFTSNGYYYVNTNSGSGITLLTSNNNILLVSRSGILFAINSSYQLMKSSNWGSGWTDIALSIDFDTISSRCR